MRIGSSLSAFSHTTPLAGVARSGAAPARQAKKRSRKRFTTFFGKMAGRIAGRHRLRVSASGLPRNRHQSALFAKEFHRDRITPSQKDT
jgi:hypothetical protein